MLPEEIEKTLKKMGDDGDKVRGTLERDFAEYVRKASAIAGTAHVLVGACSPFVRPIAVPCRAPRP